MARIFSLVEDHNCDYGVDFFNGVALVPDADSEILTDLANKGYTVVEGNDAALSEIEKLPMATLRELATALKVNPLANKAALLSLFAAQNTAINALAKANFAISGIVAVERVDAMAVGQPAQVNDNKFTVAIVGTGAPIYTVTYTLTDTLVTDENPGGVSGKWIGVCLTLTGIADITTIEYSVDGITFSALESDAAIVAEKIANSFVYYLNANNLSSVRYIKDAAGVIYTLNFVIAE